MTDRTPNQKCKHTDIERRVDESYNGCVLCDNERLCDALEFLYDKWENGTPCNEWDSGGPSLGNAFRLSEDEERHILSLIAGKSNPNPKLQMRAVEATEHVVAHAESCPVLQPDDNGLLALARQYDQGAGGTYEFDWFTLSQLLRRVQNGSPEEAAVKRHSRICECYDCLNSRKYPQVKSHHATCGCFECAGPQETASIRWPHDADGRPVE